jgi:hypothetical protein
VEAKTLDSLPDLLFRCLAQSGQLAQSLGLDRRPQTGDVLHAQLGSDQLQCLRAETRDLGQLDERGRVLLSQGLQPGNRSCRFELEDLVCGRPAHSLDPLQLLLGEA